MTWYGRAFLSFKHYPCPKSCPPKKTKNTRPALPSAGDLRMSIVALNHALNEALTHCTRCETPPPTQLETAATLPFGAGGNKRTSRGRNVATHAAKRWGYFCCIAILLLLLVD